MSASPSFDDATMPAVRTDLSSAVIDGERVVYDPIRSEVHQLNPIGTIIWDFLDGSATVAELAADFADAFEVPTDQVRSDLLALLTSLEEHSLLQDGAIPASKPPEPASAEPTQPEYLVDPPAP